MTQRTSSKGGDESRPLKSGFFRFDARRRNLRLSAAVGFSDDWRERAQREWVFRLGEERGLVGLVGARKRPLYVANTLTDPRWLPFERALRSAYFVPVVESLQLLGVVMLCSDKADAFSAEYRGLAIAYGREVARTLRATEQLEVIAAGLAELDPPRRVQAAFDELQRLMLAQSGVIRTTAAPADQADSERALSPRESQIVEALQRGMRLTETARALGISVHTARNHLKSVYRKLHVHSQVELLAAYRDLS